MQRLLRPASDFCFHFSLSLSQPRRSLAGHSHWHNVRHRKSRVDATKCDRNTAAASSLRIAAESCNYDTSSPVLSRAVEAAKRAGVPSSVIERAVTAPENSQSGAQTGLYGARAGRAALLVRARNVPGAAARLRAAFARADAEAAETKWMFRERWSVAIGKNEVDSAIEEVEEVEDVIERHDEEDVLVLCADSSSARNVAKVARREKNPVVQREFIALEAVCVEESSEEHERIRKLVQSVQALPDVVQIWHNTNVT